MNNLYKKLSSDSTKHTIHCISKQTLIPKIGSKLEVTKNLIICKSLRQIKVQLIISSILEH